jgi:hypothetical protein
MKLMDSFFGFLAEVPLQLVEIVAPLAHGVLENGMVLAIGAHGLLLIKTSGKSDNSTVSASSNALRILAD